MRPAGEVRLALFNACQALATPERGPTLQEIAAKACVGLQAARNTVPNMVRAKQLRSPRTRRVAHRNRPVAEYAPASESLGDVGFVDLGSVLRVWGG
ncbi:hypothetical protein GmRootA79_16300 [Acidovorax sp. A79]